MDALSLATAIRSEDGIGIIGLSDSSPKVWARASGIAWIDSLVSLLLLGELLQGIFTT